MVIRRFLLAAAGLTLFTGLASAQGSGGIVGGSGSTLVCTANTTTPAYARAEGYTELVGDIVISCSGGTAPTAGAATPLANITVSLNTLVTSRVFTGGLSEALLLVDEPGTGVVGGTSTDTSSALPQKVCSSASGAASCAPLLGTQTVNGITFVAPVLAGVTPNVFEGVVNGNQVTFNGVPMVPPGTTAARVFRITNIRANANQISLGAFNGTSPITAAVTVSGNAVLQQSLLTTAYVYSGLGSGTGAKTATGGTGTPITGLAQCSTADMTGGSVLQFTEGFGNAFKTRVQPTGAYIGAGTTGGTLTFVDPGTFTQATPAMIYNSSESGFIIKDPNGNYAGLASFGTRLKASFYSVPSGVTIYVSTTNLTTNNLSTAAGKSNSVAIGTNTIVAALVSGETATAVATGTSSNLPAVANTTAVGAIQLAPVAIDPVTGNGQAVWEVIADDPSTTETANFAVYYKYAGNPGATTVAPAGTIALSFAPTQATAGSSTSTAPIPRFSMPQTPSTFIQTSLCSTSLLFPFVSNQGTFDTGIAIANTSADPFSTNQQNGACKLYFYGDGQGTDNTSPFPSDNTVINAGQVHAEVLSTLKKGFQGYVIATCSFQLAHGYALLSDMGIQHWASGYVAQVLQNAGKPRGGNAASEALNQ